MKVIILVDDYILRSSWFQSFKKTLCLKKEDKKKTWYFCVTVSQDDHQPFGWNSLKAWLERISGNWSKQMCFCLTRSATSGNLLSVWPATSLPLDNVNPVCYLTYQATKQHKSLYLVPIYLLCKIFCGNLDRFSAHLFSIRYSSRPKAELSSQKHRDWLN